MMTENDLPETEYDPEEEAPAADSDDFSASAPDALQSDTFQTDNFNFAGANDGFMLDDSLDIDAALAAVSSLSDLLAEREAQETVERQQIEREVEIQQERARRKAGYAFPHPPTVRLQRGSPASVIPALLLMLTGGYLTFALTLTDTPPAPGIIVLLVGGSVGIALLSHGLASGRWSRGSIFGGLTLLLVSLGLYLLTLPSLALLLTHSGLLVIAAVGLALLLTGMVAKPASGGLVAIGLAVIAACGVLFVLSDNLSLLDLIRRSALVVLPVLLLLLVLGVIFRRRGISTTQPA